MGDQGMDAAYKIRDTEPVNASANIAHRLTGRTIVHGRDTTSEPSAGFEEITRTDRGVGDGPSDVVDADGQIEVMCGPLLNYKRMSKAASGNPIWHGSVLIVTRPLGQVSPSLSLKHAGRVNDNKSSTTDDVAGSKASYEDIVKILGLKLYEDMNKAFWRFSLELPIQDHEAIWEYTIPNIHFSSGKSARTNSSKRFVVPAASESMRMMFHSCNGFSVGTDEDAWSGPALWGDVLRVHRKKPFHVMIGGGDQIYNDGVRVDGPLKAWTEISNPKRRRDYPFPEKLRDECDRYYFGNYVRWFSTEPFASANGVIPQVNIWDDHGNIYLYCNQKPLLIDRCRHHRRLRQLYRSLHAMRCFPRHWKRVHEILSSFSASHTSPTLHLYD